MVVAEGESIAEQVERKLRPVLRKAVRPIPKKRLREPTPLPMPTPREKILVRTPQQRLRHNVDRAILDLADLRIEASDCDISGTMDAARNFGTAMEQILRDVEPPDESILVAKVQETLDEMCGHLSGLDRKQCEDSQRDIARATMHSEVSEQVLQMDREFRSLMRTFQGTCVNRSE